ncbi:MAG: J domain-containing protein [Rhodoglobus sp.]
MESPTHYELLCVTPEATADEIRAAYRRLVRVYHPDVAGAAGTAMTLRLNEAQRVLLDPDLRSRVDRPASHSGQTRSTASAPRSTDQPARDFHREAPYRSARSPAAEEHSIVWDILAISSITTILVTTIGILTTTYSGPLGEVSPRMVPPLIVALAWMAAGLSRPPRFIYFLFGSAMLLWPLGASGLSPFAFIVSASPDWVWAMLTASFVATIVLRVSAPRVTQLRSKPSAPRWASTA